MENTSVLHRPRPTALQEELHRAHKQRTSDFFNRPAPIPVVKQQEVQTPPVNPVVKHLREFVAALDCYEPFEVPEPVLDYLERVLVRDKDRRAVIMVLLHEYRAGKAATLETTMEAYRRVALAGGARGPIKIEYILKVVAAHYPAVTETDILGDSRKLHIVRPRQVVMFFSKELTGLSYARIGRSLNGRDHTTVRSGYMKVVKDMGKDLAFAAEVNRIRQKIQEFSTR